MVVFENLKNISENELHVCASCVFVFVVEVEVWEWSLPKIPEKTKKKLVFMVEFFA